MLKVGDKAPDFTLEDQSGEKVQLSKLQGKKVLISFHPLACISVCRDQMRAVENHFEKIKEKSGSEVLGISVDAQPTKSIWAKGLSLENIKILADFEPKGQMAKDYDLFNTDLGTSERANLLIDEDGKIAWIKKYELSELPSIEEVLENI